MSQVLSFLANLYDSGIGYSTINTARSALSSGVELSHSKLSLGQHPLINRFLKVVFQFQTKSTSIQKYLECSNCVGLL